MTKYVNELNGGSDGTALTLTNLAAAGTNGVRGGVSSSLKFSSAAAMDGSAMGVISSNIAELGIFRDTVTGTKYMKNMFSFSIDALPSADLTLIQYYGDSNATRLGGIHISSGAGGKIRLTDSASFSGVWTSSVTLVANKRYDVECVIYTGTSTSDGVIKAFLWDHDSGALLDTGVVTNANLASGKLIDNPRWGKCSSVTTQMKIDHMYWDDASTDLAPMGPWLQTQPPTPVVATTSDIYMVDARGSVSGGGVLGFSLTPTTGVTEVVEGLFAVVQQANPVDYTLTINQGGTNYTSTVTVPAKNTPVQLNKTWRKYYDGTAWK